jgi:predicted Rossmann fold nucleotide-binding protein DprA/Smf involved in DNA uptake
MDMQAPPAGGAPPEMTDQQKKLYETMKRLSATAPDKGKTADDIMKAGKFAKGQMLAWLQEMEKKGIVKRQSRDKAAWYYLAK